MHQINNLFATLCWQFHVFCVANWN